MKLVLFLDDIIYQVFCYSHSGIVLKENTLRTIETCSCHIFNGNEQYLNFMTKVNRSLCSEVQPFYSTLKMTTAQVVETSVTNNSLSEDYSHPDDHTRQTI